MSYVIAALIALFAGWWIAATDALFRAEERPGLFHGTPGMLLLLLATGAGGLLLAGTVIWFVRIAPSDYGGSLAVIMLIAAMLGGKASNRLHVRAAGAANRMLVGLAGLTVLYGIVWSYFPVS